MKPEAPLDSERHSQVECTHNILISLIAMIVVVGWMFLTNRA